jgi:hypothetical protein
MAEEQLTLGVALIIFDVHTMKMVWSFNGQGNAWHEGRDGAPPMSLAVQSFRQLRSSSWPSRLVATAEAEFA